MPATVRELWRDAAQRMHSRCDDCGEHTYVARQRNGRTFQCLPCFTASPTGSSVTRKLVRQYRRAERTTTPATTPAGAHELHAARRLEGSTA